MNAALGCSSRHLARWSMGLLLLICGPLLLGACSPGPAVPIPDPDTTDMEPLVKEALTTAREATVEAPRSAASWGKLGMVCHVHDLFDEAIVAYGQAAELDPSDVRWPYFLGDLLATLGTDTEAAEAHLRRAVTLRPDHAPAHMRLANVLVAQDDPGAADAFAKALELEPELHPARVGLGQARLSQGRVEEAITLLEEVLRVQPGNGRALTALAQAYGRAGRREEAREIAERADDGNTYNLYSDPLMAEVIAQGVSSTLLWDRAKAYLEDGNYRQALAGLRRVVKLLPDNPGVHHQLAFAYREIGERDRAIRHLVKAVELEPERPDARVQLAGLLLEAQKADQAIPHLRHVHRSEAEDAEAGWLLGRAWLQSGDPAAALTVLQEAAQRASAAGTPIPANAHDDWGNALAQQGRFEAAAEHFRAAVEAEPRNGRSRFHLGLAMEGLGRPEEAVEHYRQALELGPNELAAARLAALGQRP